MCQFVRVREREKRYYDNLDLRKIINRVGKL